MIKALKHWLKTRKINKTKTGYEREKELATLNNEPWVAVVEVEFEEEDPTLGNFNLDWNEQFIDFLVENGYSGRFDEEIVNQWMNDLCAGIAQDLLDPQGEVPDSQHTQRVNVQPVPDEPGKKIHR